MLELLGRACFPCGRACLSLPRVQAFHRTPYCISETRIAQQAPYQKTPSVSKEAPQCLPSVCFCYQVSGSMKAPTLQLSRQGIEYRDFRCWGREGAAEKCLGWEWGGCVLGKPRMHTGLGQSWVGRWPQPPSSESPLALAFAAGFMFLWAPVHLWFHKTIALWDSWILSSWEGFFGGDVVLSLYNPGWPSTLNPPSSNS